MAMPFRKQKALTRAQAILNILIIVVAVYFVLAYWHTSPAIPSRIGEVLRVLIALAVSVI